MRATALAFAAFALAAPVLATPAGAADTDWKRVDEVLGRPGADQPGGVHKFGLPRTDLRVTLDGVAIEPALALGSWLAFQPAGGGAMVMGDLVLTQEEVNPVMSRLAEGGIEITALHNHLLRARPRRCTCTSRATATRSSSRRRSAPRWSGAGRRWARRRSRRPTRGAGERARHGRDRARARPQGHGERRCYQVSVPRAGPVADGGMAVPPAMGSAEAINFQAAGEGQGGDDRRLRARGRGGQPGPARPAGARDRGHGDAQPHARRPAAAVLHALLGRGQPEKLAEGLKAALDKVAVKMAGG